MDSPDRPLLTFAIPTFNRVDCLRLLLEAIVPQARGLNATGRVEILVCDNASTDGTGAYLDALAAAGDIRLLRHAENIGADANVIRCFELAQGRHVWICGDDDLPLQGVLGRVVELLAREHPELLYLPARWHAGALDEFVGLEPVAARIEKRSPAALAVRANAYFTFISSWVVDRDAYARLAQPADPRRHAGTSLPQLEWHLALLARGSNLMACDADWVMARSGNTGGYRLFDVFIRNFDRIMRDQLQARPELQSFFVDFMLRSYLPGLVWALRKGDAGDFDHAGLAALRDALRETWPQRTSLARVIEAVAGWPRPLAAIVFGLSWGSARVWLRAKRRSVT